jgi:tyrosine-protein kinase Etk/Wzc
VESTLTYAPASPNQNELVIDVPTVLWRAKRSLIIIAGVSAMIALMVAMIWPVRYTATTKILPPQQNQSLASAMLGQLGPLGSMASIAQKDLGVRNPNDLYVGMLKSRTIEDTVIARFELLTVYGERRMSDTRKELEDRSHITSGKEGFITISVEDQDPKRATDIANAYVEQLKKLSQSFVVNEAGQRRLFFDERLQEAKAALQGSEEELKRTQQRTGLIQLDSQAKAIVESVVKLRAEVAAKEVQLRAMRSFATEKNADVRILEEQLIGLREQLASLAERGGGSGDVQVATGRMAEAGLEYVRKLRDFKYHEAVFELLAKQAEAARLDEAKAGTVIQVLDPAVEPDKRSSPNRTAIIAIGILVGLIAGVVRILGCEISRVRAIPLRSSPPDIAESHV